MAQVALERPPRSPSGDLELSTSETAARRFCLLYDCVRNKYWRPFDLQAGPHHDWGNLCSAQENMFRKVENDHHQSYLCRLPTKTRSWISWRISHKGLSVQSVELVLSGIRTFSADAQVKPVLRCGDHNPWPVFIHPADKQDGGNGTGGIGRLRVEDIGPADFTELRVDFEGGAGEYNEWQHSQLFRTTNHSPNKQNLFLLIRFTEADDDDIIRADFNADQMMACRLISNFSFTGNKYRRVGEAGRAELAGIGRVAAAAAAAEGRRRRVVDPRREAYLQRLADMGAIRRFAAMEGGRRRPNPNPNPNDDLAQPRRGEDRENGETQEDKRAAFADVALRELCLRTRRERMEVARCVERKLDRGKRIVDLFSEALDAAEGSRTPLLEALFPPHYEDFCLVAINLLHFQLRVQRKEDGNSVSRNLTEQFSKGQYHWNVEYVDNETGRPQFSPRHRTVRPYDEWNNDLGGGWDNLGNNGWGNANFGNPAGFYPQHGNARLALVEAAAVMGYGLDESPLPFKFTCRSGSLQPENHMLEILVVREVADGPGGEKQKMLKKFRVRPAHDGSIILDSSRVQQQADLQCPTAEPFDMQEGIDCLIQIRVLERRRNFTDFKFDEKGEGISTSSAAVAVAPDTHMSVTGVLNVSGTRLYVSKELLHLVSPFFFKLFTQEFAEKGLNEVQLHGLNAAEVEDFLLVVSSRLSAKPVHPNPQNMAALLELAEYFDVPFLTQELGHLFPVFAEIPMHIRLTLAVRYRLTEVKDSLIDSELGEESALLCQRLLLPKLGGQKERELVLDGYLQGKSNKAILKEMLASCM